MSAIFFNPNNREPSSPSRQTELGLRFKNENCDPQESYKKARESNKLRAHADGSFSVRINGRWSRGIRQLTQEQFLSLLAPDRERLVLREFLTGRSVTGCPVIVSRPLAEGALL